MRAYLLAAVATVGLSTPAIIDPSVSVRSLAWSGVGAFFAPASLLVALAFWQCRSRDAAGRPSEPAAGQ